MRLCPRLVGAIGRQSRALFELELQLVEFEQIRVSLRSLQLTLTIGEMRLTTPGLGDSVSANSIVAQRGTENLS